MKWIEFEQAKGRKRKPANYVKRTFSVERDVRSARLRLSALGVYKAELNGRALDEQVLLPGYTDYKYRVQYQEYDVTDRLRRGENELFAVVGDGWYRGSIGISSKINCYGDRTKFGCELTIEYADGAADVIEADETFLTGEGPLRENDLKTLEVYDAQREPGRWRPAVPSFYAGAVIPQEGERILEHERSTPEVLRTPNSETVLDFGQNMAGYVAFRIERGAAGHAVRLTMGETLDQKGNFTLKNLTAEGASLISGGVGQQLVYICKDGEQTYKPHFLVSGFRFVKLENWNEPVKPENFEAIAVYSDLPFTGDFHCSNEKIDRLVQNVRRSQKSNFIDIPTDCPTRERAGWTGDISVFCETACYLSDPRRFLEKWLRDYMLEQEADGSLPYVVPDGGYSRRQRSGCGWSDAICNIAMTLYRFYGDTAYLSMVYDCVRRFAEYQRRRAVKKNPLTRTKNGPRRRYVIEAGYHYGEWLEPDRPMYRDFILNFFYPDTEFTTAWFYRLTKQLSEMARILGKTGDAAEYAALSGRIRDAYRAYFLPDGVVRSGRQCRYVRPLFMGLSGDGRIAGELNRMVIENGYRIGTGFHTTYQILPVLCDYGYTETAYRLLENERCPGWLYEITKGATTTWENWNGVAEDGTVRDSLNHYAPGAVAAWLFAYCAGIRPLKPGFAEIQIKPYIGGTLTWAECSVECARGRIRVRWERTGGKLRLAVDTPADTVVILPDGTENRVPAGNYQFECEAAV